MPMQGFGPYDMTVAGRDFSWWYDSLESRMNVNITSADGRFAFKTLGSEGLLFVIGEEFSGVSAAEKRPVVLKPNYDCFGIIMRSQSQRVKILIEWCLRTDHKFERIDRRDVHKFCHRKV